MFQLSVVGFPWYQEGTQCEREGSAVFNSFEYGDQIVVIILDTFSRMQRKTLFFERHSWRIGNRETKYFLSINSLLWNQESGTPFGSLICVTETQVFGASSAR